MANVKYGIRFCNVAPAMVKTPMLKLALLSENNQIIEVDDIAKTVLWIYEQPQNICIRDIVVAPIYYDSSPKAVSYIKFFYNLLI
jgi:NADP-dependent 3-hydroxy acid dehydrogenase YdfG